MLTVPKRYEDARITPDDLTGWSPDVHDTCKAFLSAFDSNFEAGIAPALIGKSGAGKTHAMGAITNYLIDHYEEHTGKEFSYVWAPVSEVFNLLAAHRDFRTETFWKLDYQLKWAPWVVFDDFGFLSSYPRHQDMFWMYLNHRYDHKKLTGFTAQFDLPEGLESLEKVMGEAMARRIHSMSTGLMCLL